MSANTVKKSLKCKICGHAWIPRRPNPKSCPSCKRYDFNGRK